MTKEEYYQSGCETYYCKFILKNGTEEYGVITTFFPDEPNNFYLVRANEMPEFKKLMDENNYKEMKELAVLIDLGEIEKAERLL